GSILSGIKDFKDRNHDKRKDLIKGCCAEKDAFLRNGALQVHTKRHFGIKDFKCECPGYAKAFCQSNDLPRHKISSWDQRS
ncbi:3963_t:CDS:2, partial [Entrophospora sp. SA101]